MKISKWHIFFIILLLGLSTLIYFMQIEIFHKPSETLFYIMQDLAFLPAQVLLVTIILNELIARRERRILLDKMNMVIGAFFSDMGADLIGKFLKFERDRSGLDGILNVSAGWKKEDFVTARKKLKTFTPGIDSTISDLAELKQFLAGKQPFLLGLLGNQNLLEHQSFTDLLWATSHLTEELIYRMKLPALSREDYDHLSNDIKRAYSLILIEWLDYVNHLRTSYPFIYALVIKTNPFKK